MKLDEKYYDIGDIYIGYGNPQTNVLYLQYKWSEDTGNPHKINRNGINNNYETKENRNIISNEIESKIRLNKDSYILNKNKEKNNKEKFLNNSSLIFSDIKENTEKSNYLIFLYNFI